MPPITKAAIDVGTNSVRLLVAVTSSGKITQRLHQLATVTGLGRERSADGSLSAASQSRTLAVIKEYGATIRRLDIADVRAATTSAVRNAPNGPEFVERVRSETGIDLAVISGAREGLLTFRGATSDIEATSDCLVIDIGGGSTEFSWGKAGTNPQVISLELGCVQLREDILIDDPPGDARLVSAERHTVSILERYRIPQQLDSFRTEGLAIAVAGTPTSLVAMAMKLEPYDPKVVHGQELTYGVITEQLAHIALLSLSELARIPGLQPDRAPTIVAGVVILRAIMETLGLEKIRVSERDILDGLLVSGGRA